MARRKRNQKKTDETIVDIVEVRDQAQGFIDKNQNLIFGGLTAIVLLIGGFFAYNYLYMGPRQQAAVEQMQEAQAQFERDSFASALSGPGGGFMGFLDIIDEYSGTKAANTAKYYAGISYLNLGQYQEAVRFLDSYKPKDSITPIMKYGALGDAYGELNDFEGAMIMYNKAVNKGENEMLTPYYLKKVGLLHERNGDFAGAKEAYERIKSEYPNAPDSRDIDKFISRVATKG